MEDGILVISPLPSHLPYTRRISVLATGQNRLTAPRNRGPWRLSCSAKVHLRITSWGRLKWLTWQWVSGFSIYTHLFIILCFENIIVLDCYKWDNYLFFFQPLPMMKNFIWQIPWCEEWLREKVSITDDFKIVSSITAHCLHKVWNQHNLWRKSTLTLPPQTTDLSDSIPPSFPKALTSTSRIVKQFHFTAWPENGAPASGAGMIDLIDQVTRTQQQTGNKPIIIHCRCVMVWRSGVSLCGEVWVCGYGWAGVWSNLMSELYLRHFEQQHSAPGDLGCHRSWSGFSGHGSTTFCVFSPWLWPLAMGCSLEPSSLNLRLTVWLLVVESDTTWQPYYAP